MPTDLKKVFDDPEFRALPEQERVKVLMSLDPEFKTLPPQEQLKVVQVQGVGETMFPPEVSETAPARFLSGVARTLDPSPLINAVMSPWQTTKAIAASSVEHGAEAIEAAKTGEASKAIGHTFGAIPLVGPALFGLGERAASGDIAGAFGEVSGLAAPLAATKLAKMKAKSLTPEERNALQFGEARGLPIDLAMASGNPLLEAMRGMAQRFPLTAVKAKTFRMAQEKELKRVAGEIKAATESGTTTKYTAGTKTIGALRTTAAQYDYAADMSANLLRDIEALAKPQRVRVGTRIEQAYQSVILGPSGKALPGSPSIQVPVFKNMPAPVDLRSVKIDLKSIVAALEKQIPLAQQEASPGLKAMQQILAGEDYVPLSQAMTDLSTLKSLARTDPQLIMFRQRSKGLAARIVSPYHKAVEDTVTELGPDALEAWEGMRSNTTLKYQLEDTVRSALRKKPAQTINWLTSGEDQALDALNVVKTHTPQVLPDIARSYLERLMNDVMVKGQTKTSLNRWTDLGKQTKDVLFDPAMQGDIDNFLEFVRMTRSQANWSGSGNVANVWATGMLLVTNPVAGVSYLLTARQLAKALYAPGGAKLLTEGMKMPVIHPMAKGLGVAILGNAVLPKTLGDLEQR